MLSKDERINELLADKEFFKKITSMKTVQEVVDAFKDEGVEISTEEVQEIETMINEVIGKLNEEALGNVSGGGAKVKQFASGYISGFYGPAYAYDSSTAYTEPKTKSEKAARYSGIALGAVGAFAGVGIPWLVPMAWRSNENHSDKYEKKSKENKRP